MQGREVQGTSGKAGKLLGTSGLLVESTVRAVQRRSLGNFCYTAPIGAFFCPEIRAFTGFGARCFSTVSTVLSDRKVLFKHKNGR